MKLSLFLLACAAAIVAAEKQYDGYKVIRVYPQNDAQLEYLAEMRAKSHYDFWTDIRRDFVDIMVTPVQSYVLKAQLMLKGMRSEVFIEDVQDLMEQTRPAKKAEGKLNLEKYNRLAAIHGWLDELAAANPDWVSVENAGQSYLGNDMKILRLNSNNSPHKFWIDSGIHAREWISPATVLYIIDQLVNNYEANKELVDSYDWYILPLHNPDGYEYSHTDDRLWRGTLTDHGSFWGCLGADPNRNWDFHWMDVGASDDKCSEIYAGPEPFSEKCCSTIRDYVANLNADGSVLAYFTYHSYSQLWMSPWGWTSALPPTYDDLERVGVAGMNALMDVYGTEYEFGTSTNVIYAASGASDDYAYGVHNIPFVYTIELRDQGRYGFLLPESQITESGVETFAGLAAAAKEILVMKK
jgi:hypothetical protein